MLYPHTMCLMRACCHKCCTQHGLFVCVFVCVCVCVCVYVGHNHKKKNNNPLWPFVRDYPCEPLPEETFTHSHLSWSSIILYQLPPSTTIHSDLPVQFSCFTIFCTTSLQVFGLTLDLAPSTSYSIHFFTQSLSSFCNTCPYHYNLFVVCLLLQCVAW